MELQPVCGIAFVDRQFRLAVAGDGNVDDRAFIRECQFIGSESIAAAERNYIKRIDIFECIRALIENEDESIGAGAARDHVLLRIADEGSVAAVKRSVNVFDRVRIIRIANINRGIIRRCTSDRDRRFLRVVADAGLEIDSDCVEFLIFLVDESNTPLRIVERERAVFEFHDDVFRADRDSRRVEFVFFNARQHHNIIFAVEIADDIFAVAFFVDKHVRACAADQFVGNIVSSAVERRARIACRNDIFLRVTGKIDGVCCQRRVDILRRRYNHRRVERNIAFDFGKNDLRLLVVFVVFCPARQTAVSEYVVADLEFQPVCGIAFVDRQFRFAVAGDGNVDNRAFIRECQFIGSESIVAADRSIAASERNYIKRIDILECIGTLVENEDESIGAGAARNHVLLRIADEGSAAAVNRSIDIFDRSRVIGIAQIERNTVRSRTADCNRRFLRVVANIIRQINAHTVNRFFYCIGVVVETNPALRIIQRKRAVFQRHGDFIRGNFDGTGVDISFAGQKDNIMLAVEVVDLIFAVSVGVDEYIRAFVAVQFVVDRFCRLAAVERRARLARNENVGIVIAGEIDRNRCRRTVNRLRRRHNIGRIYFDCFRGVCADFDCRLFVVRVERQNAVLQIAVSVSIFADLESDRVFRILFVDCQLGIFVVGERDGYYVFVVGKRETVKSRAAD